MQVFKQSIASHFRSIAEWRRWRAQDYNRDPRNLTSAAALEELAEYVTTLPDDDSRLYQLARYAGQSGEFQPGQQTNYAIGLYQFFSTETEPDMFLDRLVELAWEDLDEQGRFGGKNLPPGDDPWA